MKNIMKRYRLALVMVVVYVVLALVDWQLWQASTNKVLNSFAEMLLVLPPIFVLLGLLDVWVKKETMVKMMGKGSGIKGTLLAFFLGSAAAGPLYAAFPVALMLLRKGSSFRNVLIMIGAWSTTKLPMLLFEGASMGWQFTIYRLLIDIVGIIIIAWLSEWLLGTEGINEVQTIALANPQ